MRIAKRRPAREPLDLTNLIAAEDHLSDEGWKWEPTEDGGTLTLRNFYLRCDPTATCYALVVAKGNIDIVLEGENIVERATISYRPLLNGIDNANWTVRETKNGGKLELKMPASTATSLPYGFAGAKLTIESGSIHSRMVLAFVDNFEMKGGSVLIDGGTGKHAAIQTLNGSAVLTGGKVTITGSVCGIAAFNINTPGKIEIDGADVTIDAAGCSPQRKPYCVQKWQLGHFSRDAGYKGADSNKHPGYRHIGGRSEHTL